MDGNDFLAVYDAVKTAAERARSGKGHDLGRVYEGAPVRPRLHAISLVTDGGCHLVIPHDGDGRLSGGNLSKVFL